MATTVYVHEKNNRHIYESRLDMVVFAREHNDNKCIVFKLNFLFSVFLKDPVNNIHQIQSSVIL